jgi:hypothetical protein
MVIQNSPIDELTQSRLKEDLEYDRATGLFFRLQTNGSTSDKPTGTVTGPRVFIWLNNRHHSAENLAWLYTTGHTPEEHQKVIFKNNNSLDIRFSNLHLDNRCKPTYFTDLCCSRPPKIIVAKLHGKWKMFIQMGMVKLYLGEFENYLEGNKVYDRVAQEYINTGNVSVQKRTNK